MGLGVRCITDATRSLLKDKIVYVRFDGDVPPWNKEGPYGTVSDVTRLQEAVPTIRHLIDSDARVLLAAHRGRIRHDNDENNHTDRSKPANRMAPVRDVLGDLLECPIELLRDPTGDSVRRALSQLENGNVLMLPNVRREPGESSKDESRCLALAREWAGLADVTVNEAMATSHRSAASMRALGLVEQRYGGVSLCRYLESYGEANALTQEGTVGVLSGAKPDKLAFVADLARRCDTILLAGFLIWPMMRVLNLPTEGIDIDDDLLAEASAIKEVLDDGRCELVLPVDFINKDGVGVDIEEGLQRTSGGKMKDIGPRSRELFAQKLSGKKAALVNGTPGVYEEEEFAVGTNALMRALIDAEGLKPFIFGGNTCEAALRVGNPSDFACTLSPGGASLMAITKGVNALPGVRYISEGLKVE